MGFGNVNTCTNSVYFSRHISWAVVSVSVLRMILNIYKHAVEGLLLTQLRLHWIADFTWDLRVFLCLCLIGLKLRSHLLGHLVRISTSNIGKVYKLTLMF